jgi:hypothetical protein
MTAQTTPSKPSTRPTVARKPTEFLFKILSFLCFSQNSKYNPGKSNEGIATETTLKKIWNQRCLRVSTILLPCTGRRRHRASHLPQ